MITRVLKKTLTCRSTSISNVSYGGGATLTRRSSERELSDGAKKRATSAGGADRNDGNYIITYYFDVAYTFSV